MSTIERDQPVDVSTKVDLYDATYGRFDESLYREIRRETWGRNGDEDFGQNGWITAKEQDQFIQWLSLSPGQRLLDVACGSGGPTLRLAERTGATVVGVDIHTDGINAGRRHAAARGLTELASFEVVDARGPLPFENESFDAVICIDAINHLPDRPSVLAQWARLLKPGGRLLFTDPIVVTGPLTNEEIAIRSSIGFFLFVTPDTNERMLSDSGLHLTMKEDVTEALAQTAALWHEARQKRALDLGRIEGDATFQGQQRFLEAAARIARERRLSRFAFCARKPQ
jgi:SAM-dependent methyltransferase